LNSAKHNPGVFIYVCDVSNHAQANLLDVAVQMPVIFLPHETPSGEAPMTYAAIISPLDSGTVFSFYLVNECPVDAEMTGPDTVDVQVFGEDKRRTITLHWPNRSPVQRIFLLHASKVPWTGNACE
jgi:hypothetical protein